MPSVPRCFGGSLRVAPLLRRLLVPFFLATLPASAATVSVAAASNFTHAIDALHAEFRRAEPGIALVVSTGSSGGLFAQISNGAPFDVFLSADTDYPRRMVETGLGPPSSLRIFARGRLALWTLRADLNLDDIPALLRHPGVRRIAIAQPRTAPYGLAARAVCERLGLWAEVSPRLVLGESIAQTAQFVETGGADAGFVALSLVLSPALAGKGRWRELPAEWHAAVPLDHAAALTARGAANPAAARYLVFLASEPAKKILRTFGYAAP